MPTIIKPDTLDFKLDTKALKDFGLKTLAPRLGEMVGSKHFTFDIRQLDPGLFSFPYHFHRNAEELIMIISGSFTLRSENGLTIINKGELIFFETGESSVHQFYNHDTVPCIYLDLRSTIGIDIAEYPDSGKIIISSTKELYEKHTRVEYNKGEENVREIWKKLQKK